MTTNYHDRIRDNLDRWGKRQGRKKRPSKDTTTDLSGWTQQELMLAPEVEKRDQPAYQKQATASGAPRRGD